MRVFKDARLLAGCALVVDALRGSARHLMRVSLLNFDAWLHTGSCEGAVEVLYGRTMLVLVF